MTVTFRSGEDHVSLFIIYLLYRVVVVFGECKSVRNLLQGNGGGKSVISNCSDPRNIRY